MIITIGQRNTNHIVVDDPTISNTHAQVTIEKDGRYILRDLDSKNGVFVNNRRIRQKLIVEGDAIKIGNYDLDKLSFFNRLKKYYYSLKIDFTEEYQEIYETLRIYQTKKDRLSRSPIWPILVRLGAGVMVIILLLVYPEVIPNDSIRIGLLMSVGIISAIATTLVNRSDNKKEKYDLLKLEYENRLQCPKCNVSLLHQGATYLAGRHTCINPNCDAEYQIKIH